MTICKTIQNTKKGICIGSLNKRIVIQSRDIDTTTTVDYTEEFMTTKTVWAMLETKNGSELFDGVNLIPAYTHIFYIRYFSGLTAESWIIFGNDRYDILDIENFNEDKNFLKIRCINKGDKTKEANYA